MGLLEDVGIRAPALWKRLAEEAGETQKPDTWYGDALAALKESDIPSTELDDDCDRWISLLATTFRQWLEVRALALQPGSRPWELRDRFMAENAEAQLERFGRSTKGIIWAHNGHVSFDGISDGAHLRRRLGTAYRSVRLAFSTGRISAGSVGGGDGKGDWRLATHTAHPPPEDSMERVLEQAGLECFAVDPKNVRQLGRELRMRNIGAYSDESWDHFSITGVPSESYDLVAYFREAHPSDVLPGPWAAT